MFKIGKYLSAINRRKAMKNLSWKDEETAFLQTIIDYILTSCIASVTAAVGMAATYTTMQNCTNFQVYDVLQ